MSRRDDSRRSQRGVALVEFAIVLPFLIVLLFSVWELGRIFDAWLVVTNAAREGARYAVATSDDSVVKAKVNGYIVSGYAFRLNRPGGDVHIDVNDPTYFLIQRSGGAVTVTLRARVDIYSPVVAALANPYTVTGRAVMRE